MKRAATPWLSAGVAVVVGAGFVLPIALGLWQTLLPAFGHLPAIGAGGFDVQSWHRLFALPGFSTSLGLTLGSGLAATALSLIAAVGLHAGLAQSPLRRVVPRLMTPLLAVPHAALGIGLAFMIAPSGWLLRLLSPWATGLGLPPDIVTVHDPQGLALVAGLAIKETPFLFLVITAALNQIDPAGQLKTARALGYERAQAWIAVVFPGIYRQIRLALYAVLAYSLSTVDLAIVLGPGHPPTLAVQTLRWFSDPDVGLLLPASASALLLALVVAAAIGLWRLGEILAAFAGRQWIARGRRSAWPGRIAKTIAALTLPTIALGLASLALLLIWSLAWRWSFPNALPESWSLAVWTGAEWARALRSTAVIGVAATAISLAAAIAVLEWEPLAGARAAPVLAAAAYLPLILPQPAFVFGLSIVALRTGIDQSVAAVIWTHCLFVFPYVILTLADPWRALDPRLTRSAAALGAGPWSILVRIKLPLLMRPLLAAGAIGFAVSVAQYLPTLVIGGGRIETLTTEAVALSSGGDRRVVGAYATLQALLPLLGYGLALMLPAALDARRRARWSAA